MVKKKLELAAKRALDVALSLAVFEVSLPFLVLVIPAVKLSSPGPVFFKQERAGRHGRPFTMYKFRTMAVRKDGEQALVWTSADEERITSLGRFMRDYGLDELPQLLNILKGDMSIVGPRPPLVPQAREFSDEQRVMFEMRPGVLSLAAVRGRRSLPMEERYRLHVDYVKEWSLALDFEIIWRSLFVVLGRADASERPT